MRDLQNFVFTPAGVKALEGRSLDGWGTRMTPSVASALQPPVTFIPISCSGWSITTVAGSGWGLSIRKVSETWA